MKYLALLLFLPLTALAGGSKPPEPSQEQGQGQLQGQAQGQGQLQGQEANATSGSTATASSANNQMINDYSSVGVDVSFEGGDINFEAPTIDNTPPVNPGALFPANPCHMVFSVGGSIPGLGISGGKTYIDQVCQELEWIRMGYSIGMRDAAVWQWCSMPHGAENPKCSMVQDYNREVQMLILDNQHLQNDYMKQKVRADDAEEMLDYFHEQEAERRLKAATQK